MTLNLILKFLISFSNIILSLPFTLFGLSRFNTDEVKADWQPPGYVFGIVWPILYSIFGYINLRTFDSPNLSETSRNKIIEHSITEASLQTLWLLVSANFGSGRSFLQNFLGLNVMIILVLYCYLIRLPTLYKKDKTSFFLYLPYTAWITFALILNYQIVKKLK